MLRSAGQDSPVQSRWPEIGNAFKLDGSQGSFVMFCLLVLDILAVSASTELYWQLCLPVQTWKTTISERGREKQTFSCRIFVF